MKNLKDIITEKLKLDKHIKISTPYIAGGEYSFAEFKKLLSEELHTTVLSKTFKLLKNYIDDFNDLQFIDVTDNKKEYTYYKDEILEDIDDDAFGKSYYLLSDGTSGLFFNYLNIDVKPETMINQMRYGYIPNKNRHDILNTHIFKIKTK